MSSQFPTPLVRLDNNLWRYIPEPPPAGIVPTVDQIQIQTPQWDVPALSYRLASVVQEALKSQQISQMNQLNDDFYVYVRDDASGIQGKWKVSLVEDRSFMHTFWQFFPFTRNYPDTRIARLEVSRSSVINELFTFKRLNTFCMEKPVLMPDIQLPFVPNAQTGRFSDAFTELSRIYFQTIDPNFVFEENVLGTFRFVLDATGQLSLKLITGAPTEADENRVTATAFRDYIVNTYGQQKLDFVNNAFGFSLDQVIQQGLPLVPDHIFKTNIGMCNIEMSDLEQLFDKLKNYNTSPPVFPQIVQQGLAKAFPTPAELTAFIASLANVPSVKKLPVDQFNLVVNLLMPSDEERELAFTGRKIRHLAIVGWNTQGDPDVFTPSRDLFEFMHVYGQMEKPNDWDNYHELGTHVASKKNLFRKNSDNQGWHVGILMPGPKSATGQATWYYNDAFIDDGQGNVNYVMLPACDNYQENGKALPYIKNYRSTAANQSSIDWMESIAADLNPYGPPISIHPHVSFQQEKGYFDQRTIPLWVGQLLRAEKSQQQAHFQQAIDEYVKCLQSPGRTPPEKMELALKTQALQSSIDIQKFLRDEARLHQELPEFKIAQDIACVGHSLGASLAQFGIYYFGPRRHRIPLPQQNYICFSTRGPAIDNYQDSVFMTFGKTYSDVLVALGQRWKVRHQLEYGDFIPESGESHLGTTGYDPATDSLWLDQNITVFRPLTTAQALGMTTLPTHGRRTGFSVEGRDFVQQSLDVNLFQQYDHDWWMSQQLIDIFGYRILRSSKVTEFARAFASVVSRPFMVVILKIYNFVCPEIIPPNKNGVIFLRYQK